MSFPVVIAGTSYASEAKLKDDLVRRARHRITDNPGQESPAEHFYVESPFNGPTKFALQQALTGLVATTDDARVMRLVLDLWQGWDVPSFYESLVSRLESGVFSVADDPKTGNAHCNAVERLCHYWLNDRAELAARVRVVCRHHGHLDQLVVLLQQDDPKEELISVLTERSELGPMNKYAACNTAFALVDRPDQLLAAARAIQSQQVDLREEFAQEVQHHRSDWYAANESTLRQALGLFSRSDGDSGR